MHMVKINFKKVTQNLGKAAEKSYPVRAWRKHRARIARRELTKFFTPDEGVDLAQHQSQRGLKMIANAKRLRNAHKPILYVALAGTVTNLVDIMVARPPSYHSLPEPLGLLAQTAMVAGVPTAYLIPTIANYIANFVNPDDTTDDFKNKPVLTALAIGKQYEILLQHQAQLQVMQHTADQDVTGIDKGNFELRTGLLIESSAGIAMRLPLEDILRQSRLSPKDIKRVSETIREVFGTVSSDTLKQMSEQRLTQEAEVSRRIEVLEEKANMLGFGDVLMAAKPKIQSRLLVMAAQQNSKS